MRILKINSIPMLATIIRKNDVVSMNVKPLSQEELKELKKEILIRLEQYTDRQVKGWLNRLESFFGLDITLLKRDFGNSEYYILNVAPNEFLLDSRNDL